MQDTPPTLLRSLEELTTAVQRLQAGDLAARLEEPDAPGELAALARALNSLADTLQQRKAAALVESEARFQAIFDNAAIGVAMMTLDRHIVQVNPTVTRITGYAPEEIYAIDPTDMVVPEDRAIDRELFLELVAGQRDQYLAEKRYIRRDGSLFWGRINFALVRDGQGAPLYIVGMIEDISEEKAAQDAVTAERTRLARELHDAVTQTLFSTTLIADVLPDLWAMNPEEGRRRLAELRHMTRGALASCSPT